MKQFLKSKKYAALLLCLCIISAAVVIFVPNRAKAVEYNEENPELKFEIIDSDVETSYNVQEYTPYGKGTQDSGKYTMETNAYVAWDKKDDLYIAYRKYEIGSAKTDKLTVETDLTSFTAVEGKTKYFTASAGVMIRGSLDPASPSVLVHVREGAIGVLCRKATGEGTSYTASGATPTDITGLKIEKTGDRYVCSYKLDGLGWIAFKTVKMDWKGPFLAGLAVHSSDRDNPVLAKFSGFKAVGSGEYSEDPSSSSSGSSSEDDKTNWEDAPMPDNCLLYETFTDNKLSERDGKTPDKPVWKNFMGEIETEENGNRLKHNSMIKGEDYVGDSQWTDYSASMDFRITSDTDPRDDDYFTFVVRSKTIESTGRYGYELKFTSSYDTKTKNTTCYVEVRRMFRSYTSQLLGKCEVPSYFDFKTHNVRAEVIDNTIKVFYDDSLLTFKVNNADTQVLTDNNTIVPATGGLSITSTDSIDIFFDNIIVVKLDDPIGGDYDNFIDGNWDQEIPKYAEDFSKKYNKSLY